MRRSHELEPSAAARRHFDVHEGPGHLPAPSVTDCGHKRQPKPDQPARLHRQHTDVLRRAERCVRFKEPLVQCQADGYMSACLLAGRQAHSWAATTQVVALPRPPVLPVAGTTSIVVQTKDASQGFNPQNMETCDGVDCCAAPAASTVDTACASDTCNFALNLGTGAECTPGKCRRTGRLHLHGRLSALRLVALPAGPRPGFHSPRSRPSVPHPPVPHLLPRLGVSLVMRTKVFRLAPYQTSPCPLQCRELQMEVRRQSQDQPTQS